MLFLAIVVKTIKLYFRLQLNQGDRTQEHGNITLNITQHCLLLDYNKMKYFSYFDKHKSKFLRFPILDLI